MSSFETQAYYDRLFLNAIDPTRVDFPSDSDRSHSMALLLEKTLSEDVSKIWGAEDEFEERIREMDWTPLRAVAITVRGRTTSFRLDLPQEQITDAPGGAVLVYSIGKIVTPRTETSEQITVLKHVYGKKDKVLVAPLSDLVVPRIQTKIVDITNAFVQRFSPITWSDSA